MDQLSGILPIATPSNRRWLSSILNVNASSVDFLTTPLVAQPSILRMAQFYSAGDIEVNSLIDLSVAIGLTIPTSDAQFDSLDTILPTTFGDDFRNFFTPIPVGGNTWWPLNLRLSDTPTRVTVRVNNLNVFQISFFTNLVIDLDLEFITRERRPEHQP